MTDITKTEYAEWLEKTLGEMVDMNPKSIAIAIVDGEGDVGTTYYHCGPGDLASMAGAIQQDGVYRRVIMDREVIKTIMKIGREIDEEEEDGAQE
ncbi:MAG: hypothetical protein IKN53_00715 [Oscillibacter sp.]|nr:hypothetical protein [Oscillibacter sp.]